MNMTRAYYADRPLPVTIVILFVLCITAWNGLRAFTAIINWDILFRFNGKPEYIFASGLIWVIAGLVLFIALANRKRFALHIGLILSIIYLIWYWLDRLVLQASPASNIIFSAVVSAILFIIFNALLFWPSSRSFFTRRPNE